MEIKYHKYHGLGNDFLIFDYIEDVDFSILASKICDRKIGIGSDGLIVVKQNPLTMMFYNQDGSEGTMCGNGLRCFSRYVYSKGIVKENSFEVKTLGGTYQISVLDEDIKVKMEEAVFSTKKLNMDTEKDTFINQKLYDSVISCIFTGTVHGVIFVDDINSINDDYAKSLHEHPIFLNKANINFVQIIDKNNAIIKTYERGVGWTLACGTGSVASFIIGKLNGFLDNDLTIHYKYGKLKIEEIDNQIYMIGPAVLISDGTFYYKQS